MKQTYLNLLLLALLVGLVMSSPMPVRLRRSRHLIHRRSLFQDDTCQIECDHELYQCDLRCTYLRQYRKKLTRAQCLSRRCGDRYISCYSRKCLL